MGFEKGSVGFATSSCWWVFIVFFIMNVNEGWDGCWNGCGG